MRESGFSGACAPLALLLALALPGTAAFAAPGENEVVPTAGTPADADYAAGKQAIAQENWPAAVSAFGRVVAADANNANAHNFLGYAYRKSGNFDMAFKHYAAALRLDPGHRGAHEYLGETYLLVGNLPKAEEQLQALDRLCVFGCEEYTDLKKAVAEYRRKAAGK